MMGGKERGGMRVVRMVVVVLAMVNKVGAKSEKVTSLESKSDYLNFVTAAEEEEQWVLLDFYAPWCGHCKRLNPILEEFAAARTTVRVAKVDATKHKALASEHQVDGYPTLRFKDKNSEEFRDFKGPRELEALEALDARLRSEPVAEVKWSEVEELCALDPGVVFVAKNLPSEKLSVFQAVAKDRYHESSFAMVKDGPLSDGDLAVVEKNETPYVYQLAEFSLPEVKRWVKKHNAPLYNDPLGPGIFRQLANQRLVAAAVVDPANETHSDFVKLVHLAAKKLPTKIRETVAVGTLDGKRWSDYVATFGVVSLPHFIVIDLPRKQFWNQPALFETGFKSDAAFIAAIVAHLDAVKSGTLRPKFQGFKGFPGRLKAFILDHYLLVTFVAAALLFLIFLLVFSSRWSTDAGSGVGPSPSKKSD